jgi:hypothetical protein
VTESLFSSGISFRLNLDKEREEEEALWNEGNLYILTYNNPYIPNFLVQDSPQVRQGCKIQSDG